jgi:secondary thiamine-phosphate synthase enzyme
MRQSSEELVVRTRGRGLHEITGPVLSWLQEVQAREGLLTLHLRHTSASLLIQENADPDVRRDLDAFFERLVPDGDSIYVHTLEGEDDMPAHVRTALTAVNLVIPVRDSHPVLGTWQGIYVWEHRHLAHSRRVALHFIGE